MIKDLELYYEFIKFAQGVDKHPKFFVIDPSKPIASLEDMSCIQYDCDTVLGMSNVNENYDPYWDDKKGYCDYEYDIMYTSNKFFGPRGDCFHLVLIKDNKIIAFGVEQGNYAGGIYCATDFDYNRFVNEINVIQKHYPELYEQIKDYPLANENEYKRYEGRSNA